MTLPRPGTHDERVQFLRYTDPSRWPMLGRFPVGPALVDDLVAAMVGGTVAEVGAARRALTDERTRLAAGLLEDPRFGADLGRLPFGPGDRVVALGDSITADRLGWFEQIRAAVRLTGDDGPTLVNLATSGNTTADVIERFDLVEAAAPTHVLMMLGTNDARGHGRRVRHPMASASEAGRNLQALAELVTAELGAAVSVMTPPACDPRRADRFFADLPLGWRRDELDAVAAAVRERFPACLDVHGFTAGLPAGEAFDDDGVHLSPDGGSAVARFVVDHWAVGSPGPSVGSRGRAVVAQRRPTASAVPGSPE